jgi:acetyl esterase/lipase
VRHVCKGTFGELLIIGEYKLKRFFRGFIRFLAFLSLILGGVHLLRVRTARGLILRGVKAASESLSLFLAILGGLSTFAGLLLKMPLAALAGAAGALLQVRYIRQVTRPHKALDDLYGADWEKRLAGQLTTQQRQALLRQRWSWRQPRPRVKPFWERDMVYHTVPAQNGFPEVDLHCDLWLPPERVPATGLAILYIHGGGYYTTGKDFGTRTFFRHLVAQGHMAMDINYRLAPQADLFDMLSDVQHAVAWLKENAELFGADPRRVVLAGGSAGAHLALLAAYANGTPRITPPDLLDRDLSVHAVVSYYGVVDLAAAYWRMQQLFVSMIRRSVPDGLLDRPAIRRVMAAAAWVRGVEPWALREYVYQNQTVLSTGLEAAMIRLIGGSPAEVPEIYELVSPINYIRPGGPATLLFQGAHDYLLPVGATRKLHRQLLAAGIPSAYIELPQTEHTFDQFLPEISPPAQVALYDLERFLALIV